jgi:hypothetical protein
MLNSVEQNFVTTLTSSQNLNAQKIKNNSTVLITLLILLVLIVISMLGGHYLDVRDFRKLQLSKISPISNEVTISYSILMDLLEDSLPRILSRSKPISSKLIEEFQQHHKWFSVLIHFSEIFPRSLRVLSLTSNIITILFFQTIVYNLANPDDGSCIKLTTKLNCEKQQSQFNNQLNKCKWKTEHCIFNDSTFSWIVIIFVSLITLILSTPIVMLINFIVQDILTGKIYKNAKKNDSKYSMKFLSNPRRRVNSDFIIIHNQLKILTDQISTYRKNLVDRDLDEFDSKFIF